MCVTLREESRLYTQTMLEELFDSTHKVLEQHRAIIRGHSTINRFIIPKEKTLYIKNQVIPILLDEQDEIYMQRR
jgi:hypothetical protein